MILHSSITLLSIYPSNVIISNNILAQTYLFIASTLLLGQLAPFDLVATIHSNADPVSFASNVHSSDFSMIPSSTYFGTYNGKVQTSW